MTDTQTFDARILGTITSGIVLHPDGFRGVQEAFEHILGRPVWTHELPAAMPPARDAILALYPDLPTQVDDYNAVGADLLRRYPDGLSMPKGNTVRTQDPLSSLVEMIEKARS